MIIIRETPDGCLVFVRAQPNARRSGVVGEHNGALKIAVMAPPEDGRANSAILDVLCEHLQVRRGQVELFRGATSRDKQYLIRDITEPELRAKLGRS